MTLGKVLCKLVADMNLSKKEVADKLGYPYTTFISYANNYREPDIENLLKLADFFKVSLDTLVGRSEEKYEDFSKYKKDSSVFTVPKDVVDFFSNKDNLKYLDLAMHIKDTVK